MVKFDINGYELQMDGYLAKVLKYFAKLPEHNFDGFAVFTGSEGAGKSTLAMEIAYFLDHNFSLKNIVFNSTQFNEAIEELPPKSVIIYDEADDVAASSNHAQLKVKQVISKLKRIRSKNLFIFFVTPTFFDMGKYFAIHRARFLIHVYARGLRRGNFAFYNRSKMKNLYLKGRKEWNMKVVLPTFYGSFTNIKPGFPIDLDEYEAKKQAATSAIGAEEALAKGQLSPQMIRVLERRKYIFNLNKIVKEREGKLWSKTLLGKVFDINRRTITDDFQAIYGNYDGFCAPDYVYDPFSNGNEGGGVGASADGNGITKELSGGDGFELEEAETT